jgi:metal-responsive CopG/Arc/MetJ family transcriptional regulator
MPNRRVLSVSVPPKLLQVAQRAAAKEHRTLSELVRQAIRQYLWQSSRAELLAIGERLSTELGIGPDAEAFWNKVVHDHRASRRRS